MTLPVAKLYARRWLSRWSIVDSFRWLVTAGWVAWLIICSPLALLMVPGVLIWRHMWRRRPPTPAW